MRQKTAAALLSGAVMLAFALSAAAVSVDVDDDCVGQGSVTWSEKKLADGTSKLKLKASAEDGFAFVGWAVADRDVVSWPDDPRYPGTLTATVVSNASVRAQFAPCEDDTLSFDISDLLGEEVACGESIQQTVEVDSQSFPTLTFTGLPDGLSYDERTLTVFGSPTEPGISEVTAEGVNESGFTFRSVATVRVANLEGSRTHGIDTEIPVGEYFYSEIAFDSTGDLFLFDEKPTSVAVSGSVPGLEWKDGWQLLYGTPTTPGDYTLKVVARYPTGTVETATMTLSVASEPPDDYGIDLSSLENLQVADELDAEENRIGPDGADVTIRRVTGLPTGLSAQSARKDGKTVWGVGGRVREAGRFTVSIELTDSSGETQRVVTVCQPLVVQDIPDVYLSASSSDDSRGSVTGGGAVSPADEVTLAAHPNKGFVFAGWHDSDGERLILAEGVDYRTPEVTLPADTDFAFLAPVAHFGPIADDVAPDLSEIEDLDISINPSESFSETFSVESLSLPVLSFSKLPKGVTCSATGTGSFSLEYDPSAVVASSGRSTVKVTAVNRSGVRATASFKITIEAQSDARVHVYDDYGELTPGEEIEPISLEDAVDFDRGETLTVAGLPGGLKYNAKANEKKGISARTITGTPTAPGDYTLTFTARVVSKASTNATGRVTYVYETVKATSFMTVLPYPELEIEVDEDAGSAGCKVTGAGNYRAGTKVTLKATAAKGWVFAGWDGLDGIEGLAALSPRLTVVTGSDDVWAFANFTTADEDALVILTPTLTTAGFAAEWPLKTKLADGDATLIADLIETTSWPTVQVKGLPSGVKFAPATFLLSGQPTKAGVYHVTVTAKNAGGYSFVRVLDVAVLNADGTRPEEQTLPNPAEIDFSPLHGLMTGVSCPTGAVVLSVGTKPESGAAVRKVALAGLPKGLSATTSLTDEGAARIELTGTPTSPERLVVSVSVTYADGRTLKSQAAIVVEDGGSRYLYVSADDAAGGTVSGEGVYAAGATVRLVAKAAKGRVFAGWHVPNAEGEPELFSALAENDGIDPRTATVAFPFRPDDFKGEAFELTGAFASATDDAAAEIELESDVWPIDPQQSSAWTFAVHSLSVPKVTASGLPKGVTVDAARGQLVYSPTAQTTPGIYSASLSAKNATQKNATVATLEVRVANRVSSEIGGLNPDMDAYVLPLGTTVDPSLIAPTVADGWALTAKGLPAGLTFKNGAVTGVPSRAGDYTVTFTATTGRGTAKRTETATVTLRISALPTSLTGTFTGVLSEASDRVVGTLTVAAKATGKISVSVKTATASESFAASAWDALSNGVATVEILSRGGSRLALAVADSSDWRSWQVSGTVELNGETLAMTAQRNPYGAKDGSDEAREIAEALAGVVRSEGWTLKIAETGTVTLSGSLNGSKVTASTILQAEDDDLFARFVIFPKNQAAVCLTFFLTDDGQISQSRTAFKTQKGK